MITIGMDVHVRNSYLHGTDAQQCVLRKGRCGNSLLEWGSFLAPVEEVCKKGRESVRMVLESTTNSRGIQRLLSLQGAEAGIDLTAEVVDARKLRIIAESVCTSDSVDARVLNERACSNLKLPVCSMPDDEEFAWREHLRARSDLVRMRTMRKNRVHAVLHRRAILARRDWVSAPDPATRTPKPATRFFGLDVWTFGRFQHRSLTVAVRIGGHSPPYDLFHRVEFRKGKATAIVAVARRMLEDAYTILKRDEAFRYWAASRTEATQKESLCSKAESCSRRKVASSVAG